MGRWDDLRGDGGGKTMIKMYLVKIFTLNKKKLQILNKKETEWKRTKYMVSLRDSMDREGSLLSWKNTDFKTIGLSFGIRMFSLPPFSIPSKAYVCPFYNRNWVSVSQVLVGWNQHGNCNFLCFLCYDRQTDIYHM